MLGTAGFRALMLLPTTREHLCSELGILVWKTYCAKHKFHCSIISATSPTSHKSPHLADNVLRSAMSGVTDSLPSPNPL